MEKPNQLEWKQVVVIWWALAWRSGVIGIAIAMIVGIIKTILEQGFSIFIEQANYDFFMGLVFIPSTFFALKDVLTQKFEHFNIYVNTTK